MHYLIKVKRLSFLPTWNRAKQHRTNWTFILVVCKSFLWLWSSCVKKPPNNSIYFNISVIMFKLHMGWVHLTLEWNNVLSWLNNITNIFHIAISLCAFKKEIKKNYHSLSKYELPYQDFNFNCIGTVQRQITVLHLCIVTIHQWQRFYWKEMGVTMIDFICGFQSFVRSLCRTLAF